MSGSLVELVKANAAGDITPAEILRVFKEAGITEKTLEENFIPFRNSRLMPSVLLLEILLNIRRAEINDCLERGAAGISRHVLMKLYSRAVNDSSWLYETGDKLLFSASYIYSFFSFGVLSPLFNCSFIEIYMGHYAPRENFRDLRRVGIKVKNGKVCYPDFLRIDSEEEAQRIIRMVVIKRKKRELTGINPYFEDEEIQAIRPPAAEWGLHKKILED